MGTRIEPSAKTICEYFLKNGKDYEFLIPEYQRAYSWNIFNCEKLLNDINTFMETKKMKGNHIFLKL